MKETVKRVWWKVPLYCIVIGYISFWVMVGPYGRLSHKTLPDGTITPDNNIWMLLSGILFVVVLLLGGLLFFRKMTRKELLCSATVMFVLNAFMGIASYVLPFSSITFFFVEIAEWYSFIPQLFYELGGTSAIAWIGSVVGWATVYLFVLFGKKDIDAT
jgi:LPXTG-motif cell wall-anchored protein